MAGLTRGAEAVLKAFGAAPPARWPRTRVPAEGWNGACRRCGERAEQGQLVAWDPRSGRPSVWQHCSCERPYGEAALETRGLFD